jgi:two-component sensor histidine kinase/PAS domain-containing protein
VSLDKAKHPASPSQRRERTRQRFVDALFTPAALLDPDGTLRYTNHRFTALLNVQADALLATPLDERVAPEDRRRYRRLMKGANVAGASADITLCAEDGTPRHVRLTLRRDAGDQPELILVAVDLAPYQHEVAEMLRQKVDLEAEVAERTAELTAAYRALERELAERRAVEEAVRKHEADLDAELTAVNRLQQVSSQSIAEENVQALYQQFLEAAMAIIGAPAGSMAVFEAERNRLRLLASKGFHPAAAAFWEFVHPDSRSTCAISLKLGERVVVPDVEAEPVMAGSRALECYRLSGVRAVQTTPLVSRGGRLVGMLSTHWPEPHQPSEREARLLDVLARQAADLIEHTRAEDALRAALARNENLIREVHHRVKNNLQMLCDLLYLQAEGTSSPEAETALRDAHGRIYAIARLHEQLYQALEGGQVQLSAYLGRLVAGFEDVYPDATISLDAPEAELAFDVDRAIHVGLIVNELLTNAVKHATPHRADARIDVRVHRLGDQLELQVRDNGPGLPSDFNLEQAKGFGLRIVHILARRLNASVKVESANGTIFTLTLPLHADAPVQPADI